MTEETEDAVEPQMDSPIGQIVEDAQAQAEAQEQQEGGAEQEKSAPTMIPLHVAQKLREKNRELELKLQWEQQERERLQSISHTPQKPQEEDNSRYESATREEVKNSQEETVRMVEERMWERQNPEKVQKIKEVLPQILKQRPHLAAAIDLAPNRYEEAYALMEAFTPKPQQQYKEPPKPKKEAPNAPGVVPKAAALNESVDVMNMTDAEFHAWRETKRRRR